MQKEQAKRVLEALLYMTDHAMPAKEIVEIFGYKSIGIDDIEEWISEIRAKLQAENSPLQVMDVAGGYQMATQPDVAPFIRKLYKERLTVKLSPSALETLSIIAYKQPITKAEVEQIRGVEASGVVDTLSERRLIKVVGRKETIGRPILYGTTIEFLRSFGLRHLAELPDIASIDISELTTASQQEQPEEVQDSADTHDIQESEQVQEDQASKTQEETAGIENSSESPIEEEASTEVAAEETSAPETTETPQEEETKIKVGGGHNVDETPSEPASDEPEKSN